MNQEQFEQAIKNAERLSQELVSSENDVLKNDFSKGYNERKAYVKGLDVGKAWVRFMFRANRALIFQATSAAAAVAIAFIVLFNYNNRNKETIMANILPAEGVVTVTLPTGEIVALDQTLPETTRLNGAAIDVQNQKISYNKTLPNDKPRADKSTQVVKEEVSYHELKIPKGKSYSLELSDGSTVWVNAESSIRYPVTFASNERVVHVDGEAFFDVVKDDSKLFVVKTNDYSVRVLGTKFNVKCYTDEDFVATTLVSGSVSIPTSLGEEKVISPGEQLRLNRNDRTVTVSKVDTEIYTSWINNTITLRETPLHEIVSQLRRRYDVQFVFEDSSLRDETFTGVVPLNESLNTILSMFSKVSSVDFRVEDGVVFIGKNS
jgi:hypothetical protein